MTCFISIFHDEYMYMPVCYGEKLEKASNSANLQKHQTDTEFETLKLKQNRYTTKK